MYETLLILHSWGRAALVVMLVVMLARHLRAWLGEKPYRASDRVGGLVLTILADVQIVVGLLLYFAYSPTVKLARQNFGESMQDPEKRYWLVEHLTTMLLAIVAIHVGKILAVRSKREVARHMWATIGYGLGLALLVWMSPWPSSAIARDWLRLGG
jgi:quinol-cytochrome oxidoreductase complex cytochrome b subunit